MTREGEFNYHMHTFLDNWFGYDKYNIAICWQAYCHTRSIWRCINLRWLNGIRMSCGKILAVGNALSLIWVFLILWWVCCWVHLIPIHIFFWAIDFGKIYWCCQLAILSLPWKKIGSSESRWFCSLAQLSSFNSITLNWGYGVLKQYAVSIGSVGPMVRFSANPYAWIRQITIWYHYKNKQRNFDFEENCIA